MPQYKKTIAVIGASGFIGINFILDKRIKNFSNVIATYNINNRLINLNLSQNIEIIKLNLLSSDDIKKIKELEIDICLYLASNSDPQLSVDNLPLDMKINVQGLINFLEAIKFCKKFIYFSSGAVYEGHKGEVDAKYTCPSPTLPYAISKLTAEHYIKAYKNYHQKIKNYIIVRFFGAYGPFEPHRKIYTNLLKKIYFEKQKIFTIRGDGNNLIDAMYVDDTIDAIYSIINSNINSDIIVDFAYQNPITIEDLVYKISTIFNRKITINKKGKTAEPINFFVKNKNFEHYFHFKPQISLEEGIKKFQVFAEHNKGVFF